MNRFALSLLLFTAISALAENLENLLLSEEELFASDDSRSLGIGQKTYDLCGGPWSNGTNYEKFSDVPKNTPADCATECKDWEPTRTSGNKCQFAWQATLNVAAKSAEKDNKACVSVGDKCYSRGCCKFKQAEKAGQKGAWTCKTSC